MNKSHSSSLHIPVFLLVMSALTNVYITQPVLPVLKREFATTEAISSLTISAVVLGIALSNLPFGMLADRYRLKPIIMTGGVMVALFGLVCAVTTSLTLLIFARFLQGIFIPALTTCLAAYLARSLPLDRLNVVMGAYVSATVAGGLGGRLLGGWIHPPLHWRYAFVSAAVLLLAATVVTVRLLPREERPPAEEAGAEGFLALLFRTELFRSYVVAFTAFFVFSSVFNYLPFYLSGPPFSASTGVITLLYLSYIIGIVIGPIAGRISNRYGNGRTMAGGSAILALSIALTMVKSVIVVAVCLGGICGGFFAIHSAAVGSLNRRLTANRGRANSWYVLFYYLGGAAGITISGGAYAAYGWMGVAGLGAAVLLIPFLIGMTEKKSIDSGQI